MSSTGRGSEREEDDRYYTRYPVALAICERLKADGVIESPSVMMEPSAGAGAFVSAMAEVWAPRTLYRNDLDASLILPEHEERARFCIESAHMGRHASDGKLISLEGDFLAIDKQNVPGITAMVGNPPYSFAEQHVRHGLALLTPGGVLAFLLPLNFLASIRRVGGLYQEHPPEYVYTLDKRPKFVDGYRINKHGKRVKKGTDSNEYGVFVFRKERPEFEPVIRWIRWGAYLSRFENAVGRIERRAKEEG
jgi:hypothetical protein